MTTVIVIAKEPLPGRVKTRLVPALSAEHAARVAAAALLDTFAAVDRATSGPRVLAFAGDARAWTPTGWSVVAQPAGGLDVRIAAAFGAVPSGPALLIGMDTPQVRPEQVTAFDPLRFDACLGPAADGGYWALGLADPAVARAAVPGVPMSTPWTAAAQLDRLRTLGLRVQLLDELTDVDTVATAAQVARLVPGSLFAAALRTPHRRPRPVA